MTYRSNAECRVQSIPFNGGWFLLQKNSRLFLNGRIPDPRKVFSLKVWESELTCCVYLLKHTHTRTQTHVTILTFSRGYINCYPRIKYIFWMKNYNFEFIYFNFWPVDGLRAKIRPSFSRRNVKHLQLLDWLRSSFPFSN